MFAYLFSYLLIYKTHFKFDFVSTFVGFPTFAWWSPNKTYGVFFYSLHNYCKWFVFFEVERETIFTWSRNRVHTSMSSKMWEQSDHRDQALQTHWQHRLWQIPTVRCGGVGPSVWRCPLSAAWLWSWNYTWSYWKMQV